MSNFREISPENINDNIFSLIGKDWMLISASNGEKTNAMTASWGGAGVLWNKNVVYTFIRPQRYTKEFVDCSEYFTLSFFDESYKETLGYFGRVSGRDEDKIEKSNLSLNYIDIGGDTFVPVFEESRLTIVCRKLYSSSIIPQGFVDKALIEKNYSSNDFHEMYIGDIIKVFSK